MSRSIDTVAITANQVAMQLVELERAHNLQCLEQQGRLIFWSIDLFGGERPRPQYHIVSPVELALEMTDLALTISEQAESKNKLAGRYLREGVSPKVEESKQWRGRAEHHEREFFPWNKIRSLRVRNRKDRKEVRTILMQFYRSHPKQVQQVKEAFEVGEAEWRTWLEGKKQQERQDKLKADVLRKACRAKGLIPLKDFKRLAKLVYGSRGFRPYDSWCLNYLTRNDLTHLVELPAIKEVEGEELKKHELKADEVREGEIKREA